MFSLSSVISYVGKNLCIKGIKYFVDDMFRDKVVPVPGSVVYCDLWVGAEHSGIYVDDGVMSNIVVEGVAEAAVRLDRAGSFTSKSIMGKKIYVSCDSTGAVGHPLVAEASHACVGERSFYGLVISNCHSFSTNCVNTITSNSSELSLIDRVMSHSLSESWEPNLRLLKKTAKQRLGATKWRLWDWQQEQNESTNIEPDWQAHTEAYEQLSLNQQGIEFIRSELANLAAYQQEIADENIPKEIQQKLKNMSLTLKEISTTYDELHGVLTLIPGHAFNYKQLKHCKSDLLSLAEPLKNNEQIKSLVKKMGRFHITEEKKRKSRVPQASQSEVHGTHLSDDLMRMLPSELINLEDETLEALFYARLVEKKLLTYQLAGSELSNIEQPDKKRARTGPIVACLDTSGSMTGAPINKAKALLVAISTILHQEKRSLYVILFGASGESIEKQINNVEGVPDLLEFLQQGYGGGTNFEEPLNRACELIKSHPNYNKADVLMLTDGDCDLSEAFQEKLLVQKEALDCSIYTVLCSGSRAPDNFSDEALLI